MKGGRQGRNVFILGKDIPSCCTLRAGDNSIFPLLLLPISLSPSRVCPGQDAPEGYGSEGWTLPWRDLLEFRTNMDISRVPSGSVSVNPSAIFWEKWEYALSSECDPTHARRGSSGSGLWLWGVPGVSTLPPTPQGPPEGTGKGQHLCCCTRSDYSSSIKPAQGTDCSISSPCCLHVPLSGSSASPSAVLGHQAQHHSLLQAGRRAQPRPSNRNFREHPKMSCASNSPWPQNCRRKEVRGESLGKICAAKRCPQNTS